MLPNLLGIQVADDARKTPAQCQTVCQTVLALWRPAATCCGLRPRVQLCRGRPLDPVRTVVSRRGDCRDAVTTIELVTLSRAAADQRPAGPRLLRRDVPHRALGRAHAAAEDRRHVVPAHRTVEEAASRHRGRDRQTARWADEPRHRVPRSVLLDLLGLKGAYSERDLEGAILREIEGVLLELGTGFAFVARQKRISVGKDDFHLDLLFFHHHLRRLIAVELKLESFQPAHVGQMELYLRWLDRHERAPGEEAPIGLILCASP